MSVTGSIDAQAVLEQHRLRLEALQRRAAVARDQLAENVVSVTSPDESVTLSVSPTGSLQNLRLSRRADTMTAAQLTSAIMTTYRRATKLAAERTVAIVTEFAGEDSPALAQLKASLPDFGDDETIAP